MRFASLSIAASLVLCGTSLSAQMGQLQAGPVSDGVVIDGPPPPEAPAMISRDAEGRATVQSIKLTTPLHVDGKLDESVYSEYQPFGGFLQVAPKYKAPSSEKTDVWVMYD